MGILHNLRGGECHEPGSIIPAENATDSRFVYPLTLHHNGRTGGPYILYVESGQICSEWQKKLVDVLGLQKAVQDSNKVFEVEYLSRDTFIIPSITQGANGSTWNQDSQFSSWAESDVFGAFQSVLAFFFFLHCCGCSMSLVFGRHSRWTCSCCYWLYGRCLDWIPTRSQM